MVGIPSPDNCLLSVVLRLIQAALSGESTELLAKVELRAKAEDGRQVKPRSLSEQTHSFVAS